MVSAAAIGLNLAASLGGLEGCGGPDAEDTPETRLRPAPTATPPVDVDELDEEPTATLTSVTVFGRDADATRLVFTFDRRTEFRHGEIPARGDRPRRGFIDLDLARIGPDVAPRHELAAAGVHGVRIASLGSSTLRILLELEDQATVSIFSLAEPFRLLVDVATAARRSTRQRPVRVVVLDPGHGGTEFGARHHGLKESILTLDLAQRTATELENLLPESRVMLTRRNDRDVSLEERVAFANAVNADVFVSIHLNSWEQELDRGGVTTFVLDTTNDRQALRLAARENGTSTAEVGELQRLLAGLHRDRQLNESRRLADQVHRGTVRGGRTVLRALPDRGVRSAMFYVLVGARMPAVLLEASFLSQPEENAALAKRRYRIALAHGIAAGIVDYARTRTAPH